MATIAFSCLLHILLTMPTKMGPTGKKLVPYHHPSSILMSLPNLSIFPFSASSTASMSPPSMTNAVSKVGPRSEVELLKAKQIACLDRDSAIALGVILLFIFSLVIYMARRRVKRRQRRGDIERHDSEMEGGGDERGRGMSVAERVGSWIEMNWAGTDIFQKRIFIVTRPVRGSGSTGITQSDSGEERERRSASEEGPRGERRESYILGSVSPTRSRTDQQVMREDIGSTTIAMLDCHSYHSSDQSCHDEEGGKGRMQKRNFRRSSSLHRVRFQRQHQAQMDALTEASRSQMDKERRRLQSHNGYRWSRSVDMGESTVRADNEGINKEKNEVKSKLDEELPTLPATAHMRRASRAVDGEGQRRISACRDSKSRRRSVHEYDRTRPLPAPQPTNPHPYKVTISDIRQDNTAPSDSERVPTKKLVVANGRDSMESIGLPHREHVENLHWRREI